jgi:hypothetical protein
MDWSSSSTKFKFDKDVYFTSRADVSCCGNCGLVEGWKVVGDWDEKTHVHVFHVNPYGGKVDITCHSKGGLRNVDVIVCFVAFI